MKGQASSLTNHQDPQGRTAILHFAEESADGRRQILMEKNVLLHALLKTMTV